jgi:hypothetical protein
MTQRGIRLHDHCGLGSPQGLVLGIKWLHGTESTRCSLYSIIWLVKILPTFSLFHADVILRYTCFCFTFLFLETYKFTLMDVSENKGRDYLHW